MDAPLVRVESDCEEVGTLAGKPVPVFIETNQQYPAPGWQRPGRRLGSQEAEGDDVSNELIDSGSARRRLKGEDAVALAGDLAELGADVEGDVGVGDDTRRTQAPAD